MTLKEQILELSAKGFSSRNITKNLNCSSSTVHYHLNPEYKKQLFEKRKERRKNKIKEIDTSKEIVPIIKSVNWKHAEAVCVARLIELGYEVFTPFNGGGEIDLMALCNKEVFKIQVKSISPVNTDFIDISIYRQTSSYNHPKIESYKNIDFYLIYDGTNIYKINHDSSIGKNITLRYKTPINIQPNTKMASDYIF